MRPLKPLLLTVVWEVGHPTPPLARASNSEILFKNPLFNLEQPHPFQSPTLKFPHWLVRNSTWASALHRISVPSWRLPSQRFLLHRHLQESASSVQSCHATWKLLWNSRLQYLSTLGSGSWKSHWGTGNLIPSERISWKKGHSSSWAESSALSLVLPIAEQECRVMLYEPIKEDATAPPEWRQAHFICLFIAVNFIGSGEIFSLLNVSS